MIFKQKLSHLFMLMTMGLALPANAQEKFSIQGGEISLCKDFEGNYMTLPAEIGAMNFEIIDNNAKTVRIGYSQPTRDGGSIKQGITNPSYQGPLDIPSSVVYDNVWYDVTEIHPAAFREMANITAVKIHVQNLTNIGEQAFAMAINKDSYTSVDIQTNQQLTIGKKAFYNTRFQNTQVPAYENYGNTERNCLETVKIRAKGLDIKVSAFGNCEGLTSADIQSTGIINIGSNAFSAYLQVGDEQTGESWGFTTRPLRKMWYRTNGTTLDYIKITGPVNYIGSQAFCGHINICQVIINDPRKDNTTGGITIGEQAFAYCFNGNIQEGKSGKVEINGPIELIDSFAFHLSNDMINKNGILNSPSRFNKPADADYESCLNDVTLNNTGTRPMVIGYSAFMNQFVYSNKNNTPVSIKIKGHVGQIIKNAFVINYPRVAETIKRRIRSIEITNENNSNVTSLALQNMTIEANSFLWTMNSTLPNTVGRVSISGPMQAIGEYAFGENNAMNFVTINNTSDNAGLDIGEGAFNNSFKRNEEGILNINGKLTNIGVEAFKDCDNLKTANINSATEFGIGTNAFSNAISLCELNYDNSIETTTRTLPSKAVYVGSNAFSNTGFTEMTIPLLTLKASKNPGITAANPMSRTLVDGIPYPENAERHDTYNRNNNFGDNVFANCPNLTKLTINNTATGAFVAQNCPKLEEVHLGENVLFIEQYAFANCQNLKRLSIPQSVQVIGSSIMSNGAGSTRITFEGTQPPFAYNDAFNSNNPNIVVPKGCVAAYLFGADNGGFQNVKNNNISCAYKLAESGWGSLGVQAHEIKEYKVTTGGTQKISSLTTTDSRRTTNHAAFTDVYDIRRIGIADENDILTNRAPQEEIKVYTADYYYPLTGKVGIDKVQNNAIVPQNASTVDRHIGYLLEGTGKQTYYLHHYTGGGMNTTINSDYDDLRASAQASFDSEEIPCPRAFVNTSNGGKKHYTRAIAQNLLMAWVGNTYAQGQSINLGGYFEDNLPCYFYGFAGNTFRKIGNWNNFKEGNAFIAIPKYLIDQSNGAKELGILFEDDEQDQTTGVNSIEYGDNSVGNDTWHTINGIRLKGKPTTHGIYIHNGRKEVIR